MGVSSFEVKRPRTGDYKEKVDIENGPWPKFEGMGRHRRKLRPPAHSLILITHESLCHRTKPYRKAEVSIKKMAPVCLLPGFMTRRKFPQVVQLVRKSASVLSVTAV
ncbi:hypothetical protein PoB_005705600 [Plakobranchus ocellatus]|uniref:Uncharacterized protein n=1 Tax=Plakobranchus ocellatus TaxID=259542 RepID=A0AAV4C5G8_9GAST|nr:hypothetical protein PoB_005705600 [Plakobranchus ocellatus]